MMNLTSPRATALLVAFVLAACSGSGSGSDSSPTGPSPLILFTPDRAAGANSIAMRAGDGSTASVLRLEIFATEILNLQALDFVLLYPNDLFRYEGFQRGEFIGAGAQITTGTTGPNTVTFDILRTAPAPASGSGPILIVTLTAIGAGDGRFDFLNPVAEDPFGLEIGGIDWIGGAARVVL